MGILITCIAVNFMHFMKHAKIWIKQLSMSAAVDTNLSHYTNAVGHWC